MIEFIIKFYSGTEGLQVCGFIALVAIAVILVWSRFRLITTAWKISLAAVTVIMMMVTFITALRNSEKYEDLAMTVFEIMFLFEFVFISAHVWPVVWLVAYSRKRNQMRANAIDLTVFN